MTKLKSHWAAELRLLCFQDIIQVPFPSSIIWDQRCSISPHVDENLNSERGFGQSFSTWPKLLFQKFLLRSHLTLESPKCITHWSVWPESYTVNWVLFTCVWAALCLSATQPCWAWRAAPCSCGATVLAIAAHGEKDHGHRQLPPGFCCGNWEENSNPK